MYIQWEVKIISRSIADSSGMLTRVRKKSRFINKYILWLGPGQYFNFLCAAHGNESLVKVLCQSRWRQVHTLVGIQPNFPNTNLDNLESPLWSDKLHKLVILSQLPWTYYTKLAQYICTYDYKYNIQCLHLEEGFPRCIFVHIPFKELIRAI